MGLIAAGIAGVEVSNVVLTLIPLVVIGWSIYHDLVVRPAPWGGKASRCLGRSRGALAGLVVIDCEEDRTLRAVLVGSYPRLLRSRLSGPPRNIPAWPYLR